MEKANLGAQDIWQEMEKANLGVQDIWPIALVLVVTGIGVAFGLDIIDDVSDGFTAGSYADNATASVEEGINNMAEKIPTIALVIVAAILIGILVRNLGGQQ